MRTLVFITILALLAACAPLEAPTNDTVTGGVTYDVEPEELPSENETEEEPEEEPTAKFTVKGVEGDLITLNPEAIDPDDDAITFTFTEPFSDEGEWQTQIGDEGTYFVAVTAEDSKGARTTETVRVIVSRANRPPVVDCNDVVVQEGEQVNLHDACTITDEDDEEIVVTYSGWMSSWRYETTYEDAGTHTVVVTASDRRQDEVIHTVREEVEVTVRDVNRPPVFSDEFPTRIGATENDVITLPRDMVEDPDGDDVTVTFSEPFNDAGVWRTQLGDAGTYDIDVVASDGETTAKRTVRVELALRNTAPRLETIPDITVDEGETVRLPISATDREGDELTVTISGWMSGREYQTTYEDAGTYTVRVSVTDGKLTTDQVVTITVRDVNRPPVFVTPA